MTNREVAAAFARGDAATGGSVYVTCEGGAAILWSYGTPVALKPDDEFVAYFGARTHSVTTAKQMSLARAACDHPREVAQDEFVRMLRARGVAQLGRAA